MNRIFLIRHGATAGNLEKRYIGRTDEPLCEQGISQVRLLQDRRIQADFVFVSPALRTRQTAGLLFPQIVPTVIGDLRETDFGVFEGKNAQELADDPAYRSWVDAGCQTPPPEGESISEFKARCCQAFRLCLSQLPEGKSAAFVLHGGSIMAILEAFAVPQRDFYDYHIANAGYFVCTYQNEEIRLVHPPD